MEQKDQKPWWKYAWPWILMSGPALAVIGCAITIWLAFDGADPPIHDGVEHYGLKVTEKK